MRLKLGDTPNAMVTAPNGIDVLGPRRVLLTLFTLARPSSDRAGACPDTGTTANARACESVEVTSGWCVDIHVAYGRH